MNCLDDETQPVKVTNRQREAIDLLVMIVLKVNFKSNLTENANNISISKV
jgi:hypothetical protein